MKIEHLERISREAGLEVMADILGILLNRETVSEGFFHDLVADDVEELYTNFIGPAIDRIEDWALAYEEYKE